MTRTVNFHTPTHANLAIRRDDGLPLHFRNGWLSTDDKDEIEAVRVAALANPSLHIEENPKEDPEPMVETIDDGIPDEQKVKLPDGATSGVSPVAGVANDDPEKAPRKARSRSKARSV